MIYVPAIANFRMNRLNDRWRRNTAAWCSMRPLRHGPDSWRGRSEKHRRARGRIKMGQQAAPAAPHLPASTTTI